MSVTTTPQGHRPGFISGSGYPRLFSLDRVSRLELPRLHDLVIHLTSGFALPKVPRTSVARSQLPYC